MSFFEESAHFLNIYWLRNVLSGDFVLEVHGDDVFTVVLVDTEPEFFVG